MFLMLHQISYHSIYNGYHRATDLSNCANSNNNNNNHYNCDNNKT